MSQVGSTSFAARRFQSAAAHYSVGRPPYPAALIARVAERLDLAPSDRLLDLGCGPANLATAFAPYVGEVVAVDPEPAMLALARDAAANHTNVRVQPGSAADLSADFGQFHATLIGRAFHWMDRDDTLRRLESLLHPNGAVVLFDDEFPKIPQNGWLQGYRAILSRYSDDDEDRRKRKSSDYIPHVSVLLNSVFSEIETVGVIVRQQVTAETLIERALSLSSTSAARLGARTADMLAELRAWVALGAVECVEWTAIIARRPKK
jgi:ubiquinone/menaquinone biosynthesis C-methylase UbiE